MNKRSGKKINKKLRKSLSKVKRAGGKTKRSRVTRRRRGGAGSSPRSSSSSPRSSRPSSGEYEVVPLSATHVVPTFLAPSSDQHPRTAGEYARGFTDGVAAGAKSLYSKLTSAQKAVAKTAGYVSDTAVNAAGTTASLMERVALLTKDRRPRPISTEMEAIQLAGLPLGQRVQRAPPQTDEQNVLVGPHQQVWKSPFKGGSRKNKRSTRRR